MRRAGRGWLIPAGMNVVAVYASEYRVAPTITAENRKAVPRFIKPKGLNATVPGFKSLASPQKITERTP